MACHTFDGGREVFGRYVQSLGIVAHFTFCAADAGSEQRHELFHDIGCAVAVGVGGVTLGMGFEDVVLQKALACKCRSGQCFVLSYSL